MMVDRVMGFTLSMSITDRSSSSKSSLGEDVGLEEKSVNAFSSDEAVSFLSVSQDGSSFIETSVFAATPSDARVSEFGSSDCLPIFQEY